MRRLYQSVLRARFSISRYVGEQLAGTIHVSPIQATYRQHIVAHGKIRPFAFSEGGGGQGRWEEGRREVREQGKMGEGRMRARPGRWGRKGDTMGGEGD